MYVLALSPELGAPKRLFVFRSSREFGENRRIENYLFWVVLWFSGQLSSSAVPKRMQLDFKQTPEQADTGL